MKQLKQEEIKNQEGNTGKNNKERMIDLFKDCPIPDYEKFLNIGLFINRQALTRILIMHELYKKIVPVHGVILDLGTRWGQNLALFESFRGIYEPYNYTRKLVGFDTFEGFPAVHNKDGKAGKVHPGAFSITKDYEKYLQQIMDFHEKESPVSNIQKYQIIKGDAGKELEKYFKENPETIVALAYFDMDIYEPTKRCLEIIKDHVTKGSVIGFDELNYHDFPGETIALKEVFGLDRYRISRFAFASTPSYVVIE